MGQILNDETSVTLLNKMTERMIEQQLKKTQQTNSVSISFQNLKE